MFAEYGLRFIVYTVKKVEKSELLVHQLYKLRIRSKVKVITIGCLHATRTKHRNLVSYWLYKIYNNYSRF